MKSSESKILDPERLAEQLEPLRRQGRTIVFTNGCFDLLHVGHLRYLRAARREGDRLVVAVNSDASLKKLKGPDRPILPAAHRKRVLAGLACVDFVTEFDEPTPHALLGLLNPDALIKGANYAPDEVVGREVVQGRGGRVKTLALTEGQSTTKLIERVRAQD